MENNIDLSRINFTGYSSSKNWIGYFQWSGLTNKEHKFNINLYHKAGLLVSDYFNNHWNDFFLMCALSYDDEQKTDKGREKLFENIYEQAKKSGLLQEYSEKFHKFSYDEIELSADLLRFCFDKDFILPFSEMCIATSFGKVIGQVCFLINPKLQIALYPHDDIGYGCIDLGDNPKILTDFLNYCNKSQDFVSHIEEQYR